MVEVDVYTIDDEDYYLIDELDIKGTSYLYLSNVEDENDLMIRKRSKDDPEILESLADENEVKMAALIFANKSLRDIKN